MQINQHTYVQERDALQDWVDKWQLQIYSPATLDSMLAGAGFKVIERRGGLSREEAFDPANSLFIVTLCEKA
ncbi:hypothetical protein HY546_01235 [archaeon]|nr:hypothetical protein [archaeon]